MPRNLQSRLEAAREARRPAPGPDPAPAEEPSPDRPRPLIDLRTLRDIRVAAEQARADDAPEERRVWRGSPRASMALLLQRQAAERGEAVPTTNPAAEGCPTCGGSVRIDLYDLVESVAHLTCLDCGFLFTARSPRT